MFIFDLPSNFISILQEEKKRTWATGTVLLLGGIRICMLWYYWNPKEKKRKSKKRHYQIPNGLTPVNNSFDPSSLSSDYDISTLEVNIPSDWEKLPPAQRDLLTAIRQHHMNIIFELQQKGVSVTFEDNMPWREAILSNNLLCVRHLLDNCGIDVNCETGFGIRWAACKGHVDLVVEMFDREAKVDMNNYEILRIARKTGDYMCRKIERYISELNNPGNRKKLTDIQKRQLLAFMYNQKISDLARIRNENPDFSWTASENWILRTAVLNSWLPVVEFLFEHAGVDINAESGFALRYASKLGQTQLVRYLLRKGACVKVRNHEAYRWSLQHRHEDIISLLEREDPQYRRHRDEFHLEEDAYRFCPEKKPRLTIRNTPFTQKIINEIPLGSDDEYLHPHRIPQPPMPPTALLFPSTPGFETPSSFNEREEPWPSE